MLYSKLNCTFGALFELKLYSDGIHTDLIISADNSYSQMHQNLIIDNYFKAFTFLPAVLQ